MESKRLMHKEQKANGRMLGWWLALGLTSFWLASPAWSLDLDRELARRQKDLDSIHITIRGAKGTEAQPQLDKGASKDSEMSVELIAAKSFANNSK